MKRKQWNTVDNFGMKILVFLDTPFLSYTIIVLFAHYIFYLYQTHFEAFLRAKCGELVLKFKFKTLGALKCRRLLTTSTYVPIHWCWFLRFHLNYFKRYLIVNIKPFVPSPDGRHPEFDQSHFGCWPKANGHSYCGKGSSDCAAAIEYTCHRSLTLQTNHAFATWTMSL